MTAIAFVHTMGLCSSSKPPACDCNCICMYSGALLLINRCGTKLHPGCRPPLCLLLEEGTPVPLDIVDALLDACHDHRQNGIDELHKQMSALGYAMQSGQTEIVDKVGAADCLAAFLLPWAIQMYALYSVLQITLRCVASIARPV